MNNEEGKIWYGLGIDNTGLQADANKSTAIFRGIGTQAASDCAKMDRGFNALGVTVASALSGAAIVSFGKQLIDVTGKFQTYRAVLNNTLGDPLKAGNAMEMVQDFAASTPFQVDALIGSFVKLANQGFVPTIQQMTLLGDLASSTGKGFDQLTEAVIDAQVGEFERLKEFGIRASKEGDNVTFTFKEQQTQVDFTASSIRDYILSLGELEGVQGANAEIAKTLSGQMSNLQDTITQTINEIGQSSEGVLSGAMSGTAYLVEHYEEVGKALGVLITMYGSYKAATLATIAIQKVSTSAQYAAEIAELQRLVAVKEVEKNADLQKLVIDGKMTTAQAEKIASLRAEALAKLDVMKVDAEKAALEVRNMKTSILGTQQSISASRAKITSLRLEQSEYIVSGNATKANAIQEQIYAERKKYSALQTQLKTQTTQLGTLQETASTKAIAANTLQQNINTASTKAGVTAQKLFAFATSGVTKAFKSLKLAFASNPIGLLITILTTAASAWLMFKDNADDASESQDKFNDSVKDAMASISAEQTEIDLLFKSLKSAKKGTDEYNSARTSIQNKYGQYLSNMSEEVRSLNDVATAYKLISERAIQSAKDRAVAEITSQKSADYAAKEMQSVNKMMEYFSRSGLNESQSSTVVSAIMKSFRSGTEMSEKDIKYIDTLLRETFKDMTAYGAGSVTADGTEVYDFWIGGMLKSLGNAKSKLGSEIESINKVMSAGLSDGSGGETAEVQNKSYWVKIRDEAQQSYDALEKTEANATEMQRLKSVILDAQAKIDAYKIERKDGDGGNLNPITEEDKILIEGSIAWYEEQIKLLQEKRKTLTDAGEIAKVDVQIKGYQDGIDGLNGVDAVAQEEQRQYEERLKNFQTFAERYQALEKEHKSNLEVISEKGGTQADIDAEDKSYEEDLKTLNDEVLATIGEFESLGIEATDKVIDEMIADLNKAKADLVEDGADPTKIAAVNAEIERCIKLKEQNNKTSQSRSLKEWQDMEEQLTECVSTFDEMGDSIGGVAGEAISAAGGIAASTISMVSSISQFVDMAINGTKAAAEGASKSVQAVETASVILAVIGAVIQVAMKIAQLFNKDDDYQEEIERLQGEIDSLEWQLQNRDIVHMKENNINLLQNFRDTLKETTNEVYNQYIEAGKLKTVWDFIANSAQIAADIQSETAKKLAASYANISYSDSTIGGMEQFDDATKKVEALAEQQVLLQKQIDNENAKKKTDHGQIAEWEQQIQELGAEAVTIINEAFEAIMGGSALDWANDLGDALFDAAKKGEDGMIAWGDKTKSIVGDIMQQLLIQQLLMPQIEQIFDKYKKSWFKDNKFVEFDAVMDDMPDIYNDLLGLYSPMADAMDGLPEELKEILGFTDAGSSDREGSTASGITASQESVNESNGRLTVIQGHTYGLFESVKVTQVDVTAIRSTVDLIYTCMGAILNALIGIEKNTSHLEEMKKDMHDMKKGVDTLNRGIILKR